MMTQDRSTGQPLAAPTSLQNSASSTAELQSPDASQVLHRNLNPAAPVFQQTPSSPKNLNPSAPVFRQQPVSELADVGAAYTQQGLVGSSEGAGGDGNGDAPSLPNGGVEVLAEEVVNMEEASVPADSVAMSPEDGLEEQQKQQPVNSTPGLGVADFKYPAERLAPVTKQMLYYFSSENLPNDKFLNGHMDSDKYIPLEIFLDFGRIKPICENLEMLTQAVEVSSVLELNEARDRVRVSQCRKTLTLRGFPGNPMVSEEDVKQFVLDMTAEIPTHIELVMVKDNLSTWYVTFRDPNAARSSFFQFHQKQAIYKGYTIGCCMKSSGSLGGSSYYPPPSQAASQPEDHSHHGHLPHQQQRRLVVSGVVPSAVAGQGSVISTGATVVPSTPSPMPQTQQQHQQQQHQLTQQAAAALTALLPQYTALHPSFSPGIYYPQASHHSYMQYMPGMLAQGWPGAAAAAAMDPGIIMQSQGLQPQQIRSTPMPRQHLMPSGSGGPQHRFGRPQRGMSRQGSSGGGSSGSDRIGNERPGPVVSVASVSGARSSPSTSTTYIHQQQHRGSGSSTTSGGAGVRDEVAAVMAVSAVPQVQQQQQQQQHHHQHQQFAAPLVTQHQLQQQQQHGITTAATSDVSLAHYQHHHSNSGGNSGAQPIMPQTASSSSSSSSNAANNNIGQLHHVPHPHHHHHQPPPPLPLHQQSQHHAQHGPQHQHHHPHNHHNQHQQHNHHHHHHQQHQQPPHMQQHNQPPPPQQGGHNMHHHHNHHHHHPPHPHQHQQQHAPHHHHHQQQHQHHNMMQQPPPHHQHHQQMIPPSHPPPHHHQHHQQQQHQAPLPPRNDRRKKGRREDNNSMANNRQRGGGGDRNQPNRATFSSQVPPIADNFTMEANSFPPLPGAANNVANSEVSHENRMSDIVRGTASRLPGSAGTGPSQGQRAPSSTPSPVATPNTSVAATPQSVHQPQRGEPVSSGVVEDAVSILPAEDNSDDAASKLVDPPTAGQVGGSRVENNQVPESQPQVPPRSQKATPTVTSGSGGTRQGSVASSSSSNHISGQVPLTLSQSSILPPTSTAVSEPPKLSYAQIAQKKREANNASEGAVTPGTQPAQTVAVQQLAAQSPASTSSTSTASAVVAALPVQNGPNASQVGHQVSGNTSARNMNNNNSGGGGSYSQSPNHGFSRDQQGNYRPQGRQGKDNQAYQSNNQQYRQSAVNSTTFHANNRRNPKDKLVPNSANNSKFERRKPDTRQK